MADLVEQAVADAVLFGANRLLPVVTPQAFADLLGIPLADLTAPAVTDVNNAHDLVSQAAGFIPADPKTAAQRLAQALTAISDALLQVAWGAVPPLTFDDVLTKIVASAGQVAGDFAGQLGLTGAATVSHSGSTITVGRAVSSASITAGPLFAHLNGVELAATLRLDGAGPVLALTLTIAEASIGIAGDELSQALLGGAGAGVKARLVVTVTSDLELHVGGGTSTTVQLPATTSGGPLQVKGLQLSAPAAGQPNAGGLDLGATVSADLAGATFIISGAGLRVGFAGGKLALSPRPPDGVGINLDAGVVKGGGYLASGVGPDGSEQYSGALDLRLGFVEIKAFGIINVGGEIGFALIIVLTAEFQPGIQIGLGFTLDGVGGLVGIQHVVDVDAISAALSAHTLDSLLFPDDPVSDAPRILATLGSVFPLRAGGAVFGPMVRLGWATFVTAELGLMLSLPDPEIVIIGRLKIRIPDELLPIVSLTADLLAVITTEKLLIRASLIDSTIGGYVIGGDFGLLIRYTGDPEFALTAGGFHPAFTPPPELRGLARISIDMSPPVVLTLRAQAYAAITSATIQFGAKVEIGIDLAVAGANGHLSFDALIRFQPEFGFLVDIDAGISVHAFGFTLCAITAHLSLSGTSPWQVVGTGEADFGWFGDVSLDFGPITWGDATKPPPVTIAVADKVVEALSKQAAWTPVLPDGGSGIVHLRPFPAGEELPLHPLGRLEARQSVVPLETEITHVGAAVVAPGAGAKERLSFGAPTLSGGVSPTFTSLQDRFAMGQFLDLSDADSLARPAFEERIAGIQIAPADFVTVAPAELVDELLTYETFVAGGTGDPPPSRVARLREPAFVYGLAQNDITLAQTAVSRSRLRDPYADLATGPVDPIVLADAATVTVRSPDTLASVAGFAPAMSFTDAVEAATDAGLAGAVSFARLEWGAEMALAAMKDVAGYRSAADLLALRAPVERENVNLGNYTFLPYVRSGIAAGLTTPWDWTLPSRGSVEVSLSLQDESGAAHPVPPQKLSVLGPGDVASFDTAQVVRTHPTAGDPNATSDDLVAVDFDRPDLPWMFTPAGPNAGNLMPWLQLVVIPDTGAELRSGPAGSLDRLVTTSDQLHRLDVAWAYAHSQVVGRSVDGPLQQRLSDANAPLNCSRLLSPRKLDPQTAYLAAVVPTFLAGRNAGLGLPAVTTLQKAWDDNEGEVTLPVYFSFTFSTGERGDFEFLAHELVGVPAPYGVGYRSLDTSSPAPGLEEPDPDATGRVQVVAGPLISPATAPGAGESPRPSEAQQAWSASRTAELATRLGEGPADDPRVAPPLYAGSQAARTTTDGAPDWFRDLNLVARDRVVAGLGARVVQMDQEKLMAAAWQQVKGVDAANRAVRLAQLARQLSASLHRRHLMELDGSALLGVTRPTHTRLLDAPEVTLAAKVRVSALPESVASAAWRRFVRPSARVSRLPGADLTTRQALLTTLVVQGDGDGRDWRYDYTPPDGITGLSDAAVAAIPADVATRLPDGWAETLKASLAGPALPDVLASGDVFGLIDAPEVSGELAHTIAPQVMARALASAPNADSEGDPATLLIAASQASVLSGLLSAAAQVGGLVPVPEEVAKRLGIPGEQHDGEFGVTIDNLLKYLGRIRAACEKAGLSAEFAAHSDQAEKLRGLLDTAFNTDRFIEGVKTIGGALVAPGGLVDIDRDRLQVARNKLLAELNPAVTVTARITGRLSGMKSALPAWLRPDWFVGGLVEPIMAAPHFRLPMALRLYEYDKEWLMPGVAALKPHQAVTLLETNNIFVEAFLLGLNSEMANELLWRGYPTDRRGTYFSSFWRRVDDLTSEIHLFGNQQLGDHVDPLLGGKIVLFVRGDLVRRYPGVVAHAMTAATTDKGVPVFEVQHIETIFQVPLAPDVLLVGFDLRPEEVGDDTWFTLSENPTEPRFGFDEPRPADDPTPPDPLPHPTRDSLDWNDPDLSQGPFVRPNSWNQNRVDAALAGYATNAARFAHITFQLPARAAFHGPALLERVNQAGP